MFNTTALATTLEKQACKKLNEPKNSNGYIFDRSCKTAFVQAPKDLKAVLTYNENQILEICSQTISSDFKSTDSLNRIKVNTIYYFDYESLIQEFQNLNVSSGVFFQKLPHSFSLAAVPRFGTAIKLRHFPITITSLKNTEKVLRTYYNNRKNLDDIDLKHDRYSLLPFNNALQNTWTLDTATTCLNYFDPKTKVFKWDDFEEDRLLQLSPTVTNEYTYSILNKKKRIEFIKEISVSYYKKGTK